MVIGLLGLLALAQTPTMSDSATLIDLDTAPGV
jgi:hypothetical protein